MAQYSWVLGVVLAALASFVSNLGVNLQKLAHLTLAKPGSSNSKNYTHDSTWLSGMGLVVLGSLLDFAALAFAAQSIITPLGSLTLVANVIFAPRLLGETIDNRDFAATATIIFGSTVSVAFADHKGRNFSSYDIHAFFITPRFLVYTTGVLFMMLFMWCAVQYAEWVLEKFGRNSLAYSKLVKAHRFMFAALSGTVGAQNVLFAKCFIELLVDWFAGDAFPFVQWQTYFILGFLAITIFLQVRWLNSGLKQFDALSIVPVFQSFWIIVSVVAGLVFFDEWSDMTHHQRIGFPFGIAITVSGLYWLTKRQVNVQQHTVEVDAGTMASGVLTADEAGMEEDAEFDPTLGLLGAGPPASIGGSAVGRISTVLNPHRPLHHIDSSPLVMEMTNVRGSKHAASFNGGRTVRGNVGRVRSVSVVQEEAGSLAKSHFTSALSDSEAEPLRRRGEYQFVVEHGDIGTSPDSPRQNLHNGDTEPAPIEVHADVYESKIDSDSDSQSITSVHLPNDDERIRAPLTARASV